MRTCGNCGESGHNRRTCKKGDATTATAAPAADGASTKRRDGPKVKPKDEPASSRKGVGDDLDEETKEAIDWYMEQSYPGYLKRKKEREKHGCVEELEDDESDT